MSLEIVRNKVYTTPHLDKYELVCSHGQLDATFRLENAWMNIAGIDVDYDARGNGIGKALLRESVVLARDLRARMIYSTIVTRECLDAMRTVFGAENIAVAKEGPYADPGVMRPDFSRTSALLHYDMIENR